MRVDILFTQARLDTAMRERIRPCIYGESAALAVAKWEVPGEPVPFAEASRAEYVPTQPGKPWGPPWGTTWFRILGSVPQEWAGRRVEMVADLGFNDVTDGFQAEGLVYNADGHPIKGLAPHTRYVPVAKPAQGGEPVEFLVEAAANPYLHQNGMPPEGTVYGDIDSAPETPLYQLGEVAIRVLNEEVWRLVLDIEVLDELMRELTPEEPRRHEIARSLERMLDTLDLGAVSTTASAARRELQGALSRPAASSAHRVSAVGHAHIDTAWLWPQRETRRKTARTFANVTVLAQDYPDLVFACSQAQQYAWIADTQPEIFERIRRAVDAGQWAPVGGMWVEADVNLPGGEALVRQFVYGIRYFEAELGVATQGVWLPDSFGYSAALPQIARLAGLRWFVTAKLEPTRPATPSKQMNRYPHTFWWEGIDGSRLFSHILPIGTYNSALTGRELSHAVKNYSEKGFGNSSLVMFGYGDGGGGPTREMLEKARRLRDLEGSATVKVESPDQFFAGAMAEYPDARVWSGELYFERHRGTYTTHGKIKRGNRRCEHLLREAELWSTWATVLSGHPYPHDELDALWKEVLLQQFHDILPGSSIHWVNREAYVTYERLEGELLRLIERATSAPDGSAATSCIANAASHKRSEVIMLPASMAPDGSAQTVAGGHEIAVWSVADGLSGGTMSIRAPDGVSAVSVEGLTLDNGILRVVVDERGLLASIKDLRANRELLMADRPANLLQLHDDYPNTDDAWDLDPHYLRRHKDLTEAESVTVVDSGPLLATITVRRILDTGTDIQQRYRLAAGATRLEIDTEIEWCETNRVLKAAFPIDLQASEVAAEIQFGHVRRSLVRNTSWDEAKFEAYHHRWLQVGEAGYGVAIINDSKYGYDATRLHRDAGGTATTIRLTLLRSPLRPDPNTDQGSHRFTYAIAPGADIMSAVRGGYELNLPLRAIPSAVPSSPLVATTNPAVIVESVKMADDRSGDVIVRMYECLGSRALTEIHTEFAIDSAQVVDLLERTLPAQPTCQVSDSTLSLTFRPFQIITLRLSRRKSVRAVTSIAGCAGGTSLTAR